jgi:ABC-type nickel/cobalt efflux system permease component RcnA
MQRTGRQFLFESTIAASPEGGPLAALQFRVSELLRGFMRALTTDASVELWILLLVFAAIYGVVHTALPGHRKTLLVSYFLADDARAVHGVLAGIALAVLHVVAAVVLVLGGYYLLDVALESVIEDATVVIHRVTGGLIAILGAYLLAVRVSVRARGPEHRQGLGHRHGPGMRGAAEHQHHGKADRTRLLPAVIVSGIVPCPGSAFILLTALSLGNPAIGVAAVAAVSVGMALILTALSVATILVKQRVLRLLSGAAAHRAHEGVELAGAVSMLGFGAVIIVLTI